jgi:hypothetical protein
MSRTDPHEFVSPRYTYARVERALLAVFDVAADRQGPMRARLKHLNLLGMPGLKVGKGQRISYSLEHVSQWLVALLLEEAGIDPTEAVRLVNGTWARGGRPAVLAAMDEPGRAVDHIFLVFRPRLMTGLWLKGERPPDTEPVLGFLRHWRKDKETGKPVNAVEEAIAWGVATKTWLCLRDLTVDMRVLTTSLGEDR